MTAIVGTLFLSVAAFGQLVVNGDFESGNTGFDTDYTYLDPVNIGTWTLGPEFMYTVSTNPALYHSAWAPFPDHTTADYQGLMMIVNGTASPSIPEKIVWGQEVTLPVCDPVTAHKLLAGQTWEIGEVLVKSEGGQICVKFVLTDAAAIAEGWLITEVHVAIGDVPEDIPNKNGNPIPGKFPINVKLDPGVTETDWYCLPDDGETIIAAHAKLELPEIGHWDTAPEPDVWVVDRPYDSETGWGDGPDFDGRNWATYIDYTPVVCSSLYQFTMYGANSFGGLPDWAAIPALLEVRINGEVLGVPLYLGDTPGEQYAPTGVWREFSEEWDAGSATIAVIEIRDLITIAFGDDFVIDDISLVQLP